MASNLTADELSALRLRLTGFATALGLFAAIPAVIAYNRFGHRLNRLEAKLGRFADGFHTTLSRELDRVG